MLLYLSVLVAGASASPFILPAYPQIYHPSQALGHPSSLLVYTRQVPSLLPEPVLVEIPELEDWDFKCTAEGLYPDPEDCHNYFACNEKELEGGVFQILPTKVKCDSVPGLAFNPKTEECDIAANFGCTADGTIVPTFHVEPIRVDPDERCEGQTVAGFVADQEDCTKYLRCVGGGMEAIPYDCPPGTLFDENIKDGSPCVAGDSSYCKPLVPLKDN